MVDEILIDTSLLIEPFGLHRASGENYKEKSLTLLRYGKRTFVPCTSASILGELHLIINKKENLIKKLENKRETMEKTLDAFFKDCKFLSITKKAIEIANNILNEDNRLDPMDVLHFSIAISEKCSGFMFIDGKIKTSKVIKEYSKKHQVTLIPFDTPQNMDKGKKYKELTCLK